MEVVLAYYEVHSRYFLARVEYIINYYINYYIKEQLIKDIIIIIIIIIIISIIIKTMKVSERLFGQTTEFVPKKQNRQNDCNNWKSVYRGIIWSKTFSLHNLLICKRGPCRITIFDKILLLCKRILFSTILLVYTLILLAQYCFSAH